MGGVTDYILENKEWLFSGAGISAIAVILYLLRVYWLGSTHSPQSNNSPGRSGSDSQSTAKPRSRRHRFDFSDGITAYSKLRVSYTLVDPLLFMRSFKDHDDCMAKMAPLVHARAAYKLECLPYRDAKDRRREIEIELKEELQKEYESQGMELQEITIGSLIANPR